MTSSARDDWQTPDCVLDRVRKVGCIALDPCTSADNPTRADSFWTIEDDALLRDWRFYCGLIYCNPPYGRGVGVWVDKCREAGMDGPVIALLPARTDTRWFPWDATLCFWRGRLTFRGAPAPALFPSAVACWGNEEWRGRFCDVFQDVGAVFP